MKLTEKLGLKKPDLTDYVNIGDLNDNMDILDGEVASLKEGTTEVVDLETLDKTYKGAINEINQEVKSHKAETMQLKFSELSSTATNLDEEDIYVNAEWKRKDGTIYAKSTLLGTTPNYNQIKIDYYNKLGTIIEKSITWNLTYDENDFIYKKVVV